MHDCGLPDCDVISDRRAVVIDVAESASVVVGWEVSPEQSPVPDELVWWCQIYRVASPQML